jgi:hypothetical protein
MIRKRERFRSDDTAEASLIGTRAANTDTSSGDFMKGEVSFIAIYSSYYVCDGEMVLTK